jgi:hypothetical protein
MKLARSSFYYRPRDKAAKKKADTGLMDKIEAICLGFPVTATGGSLRH